MSTKELLHKLFYIPRSIAGPGNRKTIKILSSYCGNKIKLRSFKSNEKFGNWIVPKEWIVKKAQVLDKKKRKIVDFNRNNLELVVNSVSFKGLISKKSFLKKIFTLKKNIRAIPYITSYYKKNFWGVCMKYADVKKLKDKKYFVEIETVKKNGKMNYGEYFIKGKNKKEIIFSSYICHPQMANNELSGPVVLSGLINEIKKYLGNKKPNFSYRFLFLPETIGSIAYIHKNISNLKKNVFSGYIITCVGTKKKFKLVLSPNENTVADNIAKQALNKIAHNNWETRSFLERGSDERQWCSPKVNLPFCSICRSKYGEYKEYHTSLDNLDFIDLKGLKESLKLYLEIFKTFENSNFYLSRSIGEPKLDIYGLYPKISTLGTRKKIKNLMNIIAYCDGEKNEYDIAQRLNLKIPYVKKVLNNLKRKEILINNFKNE